MDEERVDAVLAQITFPTTDEDIMQMLANCAQRRIHPVFAKERWRGLSDEDYVRLSPGLVLATYILECSQTTHYLATVLGAPWTPTNLTNTNPRWATGDPLYRITRAREAAFNQPRPLTQGQRDLVNTELGFLSTIVTFEISSIHQTTDQLGECAPTVPFNEGLRGVGSKITIVTEFVSTIELETASFWDLLANYLRFAIVLNHEVMHAIHLKKFGDEEPEPFFEDQGFHELGNAFEQFLFLGSFNFDNIHEPPPGAVVTARGFLSLTTPNSADTRSPYGKAWLVSNQWLRSLFTDDFWTAHILPDDGALKPEVKFYADFQWNAERTAGDFPRALSLLPQIQQRP